MTKKTVSQKISLLLILSMLFSCMTGIAPIVSSNGTIGVTNGVAEAATSIETGDYIMFGNYYGAPVIWRVLDIDEDTGHALVLSDRILALKAVDAKGIYHPNKIGVAPNVRVVERDVNGSNYYPDSNIRQWLNSRSPNSVANTIDWRQNDPTAANVASGFNAYHNEKGFLSDDNFNAIERSLIVPHTHKVMLEEADIAKKDGGEAEFQGYDYVNNDLDNYNTTAYYKEITDHVFLLSAEQAVEYVLNNSESLGEGYLHAKPTPQAVENSDYETPLFSADKTWKYFLSTAQPHLTPSAMMVVRDATSIYGPFIQEPALNGTYGIRPAMKLDIQNAMFLEGGTGTVNNPYVINDANALSQPPIPQSNTLSVDAKTFRVTFSQTLEMVDKSKISISIDGKTNLANTAFHAAVNGKHLVLTLADAKATFKSNAKITIRAGTVTSVDLDEKNEYDSFITVNVGKFVNLSAATMNNSNSQVNLTFATSVKGVTVGTVALNPAIDNLENQIETSDDNGKTWSSATVEDAALVGNTIEVYLNTPLTNSKTIVRIKAGALSYTAIGKHNGNLNSEIKSTALDLFPVPLSTTLSANNKTVLVKYSENIFTTTSPAPAKGAADNSLISKISLATDGVNFTIPPTSASINKDTLAVTFADELKLDENILKISEDAVQDAKKNKAALYESNPLIADESEPEVLDVGFNKLDKTLTVYFNENIALYGTTTLTTLASGLKYNSTISFTSPVVTISKNTLVIKHKSSGISNTGTGGVLNIVIPKESIADAAENMNLSAVITDPPDIDAPIAQGYTLSNADKDITVIFDEPIFSAKAVPLTAFTITTGTGQNAVTKNLADKSYKAANTTVTIVDGNKLKISNLNGPLPIGSTFALIKDSISDITLNKNILYQFVLYRTVDEGIAVLNTADAAYNTIQDILNQSRELAIHSIDPTKTTEDRNAMQLEVNALITEINNIATNTRFNGVALISTTPYTVRISENGTSLLTSHTFVAATPTALSIATLNISTTSDATNAVGQIDAAMNTVTLARTAIGNKLSSLYD
jgi:hypothetical protein